MTLKEGQIGVYLTPYSGDFVICDIISTFTVLDWCLGGVGYLVLHEGKKKVALESGDEAFFVTLEDLQKRVANYKSITKETESILEQLTND